MQPPPTPHWIHPTAKIGRGTTVGPFSVIGEGAELGEDCTIGAGVVIHPRSRLGNRIRVDDHAVIGKQPLRSARSAMTRNADLAPTMVGDDCLIGTSVTLYAGSALDRGVMAADLTTVREEVTIGAETILGRNVTVENRTTVGSRCKIQANTLVCALSSVGDDCFIGPDVAFTNDDYLGRTQERFAHHRGPTLENGARIAGNVTVLPGRRIGRDALVGAGAVVTHDVPARTVVLGVPARSRGPVAEAELLENQ